MTTWTHSEHLADLFAALGRARKDFKPAKRSQRNDDGTHSATVADIYKATQKALDKQGLVAVQFVGSDAVETIILHTPSGDWLAGHTVSSRSQDGSVTYGPRTALLYALGVVEEPEPADGDIYFTPEVHAAMQAARLNAAQRAVIARSGKSQAEMIAEAQKMGGGQK